VVISYVCSIALKGKVVFDWPPLLVKYHQHTRGSGSLLRKSKAPGLSKLIVVGLRQLQKKKR
jgi:hypothetical protein